jgi:hypothetical protein
MDVFVVIHFLPDAQGTSISTVLGAWNPGGNHELSVPERY